MRLAYVWFTDEGEYTGNDSTQAATLNKLFNHALHEESFLKANYYDSLTGLPNMTYFFALAEEYKTALKEKGGNAALLYIDLDGMKSFNDNYGFAEGDKLLKAFAALLDHSFGSENCCHVSADHFAVYIFRIYSDEMRNEIKPAPVHPVKSRQGDFREVDTGILSADCQSGHRKGVRRGSPGQMDRSRQGLSVSR